MVNTGDHYIREQELRKAKFALEYLLLRKWS